MQEASYFGHDTGEVHVGMNSRVVLLAILVLRGKIALWRLLARVLHLMALALTGLLVFGEEAFEVGGPFT